MTHSILFGNGISMISTGCPKWAELLASINSNSSECLNFRNIPPTFQYEVLLPDCELQNHNLKTQVNGGQTYQLRVSSELLIKKEISEKLRQINPNIFYERLTKLNVKNYLTTNYDYLLKSAFIANSSFGAQSRGNETVYSIRRKTVIQNGNDDICNVWNIHGEIDHPQTLMLGLDQYCGSIGKIDSYVKGTYDRSKYHRDAIENRLLKNDLDDELSWIDTFFNTQMHIFGIGLDYSETDLWWILNRRMRIFRTLGKRSRPNPVNFYGELDEDKVYLLNKFGVKYHHIEVNDGDYYNQYEKVFSMLESSIGLRK